MPDAEVARRRDRPADGLDPAPVALAPRQASLRRPTAVAVHDDRDVPRYVPSRDRGRTFGETLVGANAHGGLGLSPSYLRDFAFLDDEQLIDLGDGGIGQ